MAGGGIRGKTRLAECLSFCQVLLGPVHNKEMDWQVEKEDREASMIYCVQPNAPSSSSGTQYIKETKIYYTICTEIFYKYKLCHLYFFGLIKALGAVMYPRKYVWTSAHTHGSHQRSGIYQSSHCNYLSMREKCITSVLWNEHYVIPTRLEVYHPYCVLQCIYPAAWLCDPLTSVLPYRLWQI